MQVVLWVMVKVCAFVSLFMLVVMYNNMDVWTTDVTTKKLCKK